MTGRWSVVYQCRPAGWLLGRGLACCAEHGQRSAGQRAGAAVWGDPPIWDLCLVSLTTPICHIPPLHHSLLHAQLLAQPPISNIQDLACDTSFYLGDSLHLSMQEYWGWPRRHHNFAAQDSAGAHCSELLASCTIMTLLGPLL